jgi:hypothetical protein
MLRNDLWGDTRGSYVWDHEFESRREKIPCQYIQTNSETQLWPCIKLIRYGDEIFNFHGSVHFNNILMYIQQDATLHSLFYLEIALHVSGSTSIHHHVRIKLYLQHLLFVRPLLLPAASGR